MSFRRYELFSAGCQCTPVRIFDTPTGLLYVRTLWDFVDPDDAEGSFEQILDPNIWSDVYCVNDDCLPNFIEGPGHA